jgi:hypothetical protein
VRQRLAEWGYPVRLCLTDRILEGTDQFVISISPTGALEMAYEGESIAPDRIAAAWYWKVGGFRVANAEQNVAKQLSLVNELTMWNHTIWGLFPDEIWINSPRRTAQAEAKLQQLLTARSVGFAIPESLVTNDWARIENGLLAASGKIVVKTLRGVIADTNELKVMFTTVLDQPAISEIREETTPFPGLYQPFLTKAREWRVTVVGDNVFPASIYTTDEAKDDWRIHQMNPSVTFRHEPLPDEIEQMCRAYLKAMELRYGAFDFVEQSDGQIIFLECNPGGQHNWLEQELGLPIADAIASELAMIADSR